MSNPARPSTPAQLWERARAMLARAFAVLGGPAAIAVLALVTPKLRREILARIAPLEHAVRKLLFVEAANYARLPAIVPPRRRFPLACSMAARPAPDLSQPHTWRARFALSPPRDPRLMPDSRAPRIRLLYPYPVIRPLRASRRPVQVRPATTPAFRLARRLEALRRVLAKPAPHARRLARYFVRVRRSYPEAAARFAAAPPRTNLYDPDDPRLGIECQARAFDVMLTDSS